VAQPRAAAGDARCSPLLGAGGWVAGRAPRGGGPIALAESLEVEAAAICGHVAVQVVDPAAAAAAAAGEGEIGGGVTFAVSVVVDAGAGVGAAIASGDVRDLAPHAAAEAVLAHGHGGADGDDGENEDNVDHLLLLLPPRLLAAPL